jgi:phosphoglycolate phosphatase
MADKTELLIFDWDDTITEGSTKAYLQCYHSAVSGVGIEMTQGEVLAGMRPKWGARHEVILADLLANHPELVPLANEIYEDHLRGDTFVDRVTIRPHVPPLLKRLAGRYTLALATGMHPEILKGKVMTKFDVDPHQFDGIVTAYDVKEHQVKPAPYMANRLIDVNRTSPDRTMVIGDGENDIKMGKAARTRTVAVLTGHLSLEQARALQPDYIIDEVGMIEEVLTGVA